MKRWLRQRGRNKNDASSEEAKAAISKFENWYHRIVVAPGVVTPGINNTDASLEAMKVPKDLSGKRVLDIGARRILLVHGRGQGSRGAGGRLDGSASHRVRDSGLAETGSPVVHGGVVH